MEANFVYYVNNIFKSSNDKEEIQISPEQIFEIPSTEISDIKIPTESSAIIIFKNSIVGRDKDGTPLIENFNPTDIKQYVVTKESFLTLPKLYARFSVAKDLMDGYIGAYVLRDNTLFVMTEKMKNLFTPILENEINEQGFIKPQQNQSQRA